MSKPASASASPALTATSQNHRHDGQLDVLRIRAMAETCLEIIGIYRTSELPGYLLKGRLQRAAYELRVALDYTNTVPPPPGHAYHLDLFARHCTNAGSDAILPVAVSQLWRFYWRVLADPSKTIYSEAEVYELSELVRLLSRADVGAETIKPESGLISATFSGPKQRALLQALEGKENVLVADILLKVYNSRSIEKMGALTELMKRTNRNLSERNHSWQIMKKGDTLILSTL